MVRGVSPILVGDKLIYSADGKEDPALIALDRKDGSVVWNTPRNIEVRRSFSFCTPLLIEVDGKPQVISPCSGAVVSYDPASGEEIWALPLGRRLFSDSSPRLCQWHHLRVIRI